jgi:DNA primase
MINCQKAKEISIVSFLTSLNIHPAKIKGDDYWYFSPLRNEKNASFKINSKLNLWYDHGEGHGGTILDLGKKLFNCSISEFLKKVEGLAISDLIATEKISTAQRDSKVIINAVSPLHDHRFQQYLSERRIFFPIAKDFCYQVSFRINDRSYLAIGFKNRRGGFELRNRFFKGSSFHKDYTFISNNSKSVCVFEGFMDFLSLLSIKKDSFYSTNFLILNSLSNLEKSYDTLENHRNIFLFLDHDKAGRSAVAKVLETKLPAIDSSVFYKGYKDLNEYLIHSKKVFQANSQKNESLNKLGNRRSL